MPSNCVRHTRCTRSAVQSEYSLWCRGIEPNVLPTAREFGTGVVAYSPLGRGFLSGTVRAGDEVGPFRSKLSRFRPAALAANAPVADAVRAVAGELGVTAAQVALAWVHAQGADLVPIPGTRTKAHLETNAVALDLSLGEAQLARLGALATQVTG